MVTSSVLPSKTTINMTPPPSTFQRAKYDFNSKYDHSWCTKVLEYGAQGMSVNTIALKLGVSHTQLFFWARKIPEFKVALETAQELSRGWWEEMGRLNLENKNFNNTLYIINMQNRFGWHRYIDPSAPVVFNNQIQQNVINENENSINIDYSKFTTDELQQINTIISKAVVSR